MGSTLNVVAISKDVHRKDLVDGLISDDTNYGVIIVESIARGYSRVKQVLPDMVIVYCRADDVDACQLLSMLALDDALAHVPVVTCLTDQRRPAWPA